MKKLLIVLVMAPLCGAFLLGPAQAQKTKAQLNTEVGTTFPDNTTGQITPSGVRSFQNDVINSIMPTAPVGNGNFATFDGTTGLLKDSGVSPTGTFVTNANITPGPPNTFKGTLSGAATSDIALTACSLSYQITKWVSGTGWQCGINPVLPSRAIAASLDLSAYSVVTTQGYNLGGDGGGATFYPRKTAITGTSLTGLGSGCTDGTWPGVKLTGGTGSGAQGTLVVSGGVTVSLNLTGTNAQGNRYTVGDVLTAAPGNIHCSTSPQITVASVGNGPFLDSPVNSLTITNAGSGCTPGTYYGLYPLGGFGGMLQGNAVIGGGGTLSSFSITGTGGGGYRVGDQLTFAGTGVAAITGCSVFPVLTVAGNLATNGSFVDTAGSNWQIGPGEINIRQFGAVADFVATEADADATDNGPAIRAALRFAAFGQPFPDARGYSGNTVFAPAGAYLACNGLLVPANVRFRGASPGGTTMKQCDSDNASVHFITQGDPLTRQAVAFSEVWDMGLFGGTGAAGASYLIYSNNNQSGDAVMRVGMYGVSRGCVKYEIGYGGQATYGIHSSYCVPNISQGSPPIAFDLSGNFGFAIDGQSWISTVGTLATGIRIGNGGFAEINGFHCEGGVTACVSVNGTGTSPPQVHVINGVGPATNFVVNESGSPLGNITLQNFVSNGTTCALYNATSSTCVYSGSIPGLTGATGGAPGGSSGQIQYNNAGAFGGFTMSADMTVNTATGAATLATVNANVGSFGSSTSCVTVTANAKGLITAISAATCAPAIGSVTGLGANVATWLATPSSANLFAALTTKTGTGGSAVFATAPTITTPNIIGVTDGSSASAGSVGEFLFVSAPNSGNTATITVTIASPGVVTWTGHPFSGPSSTAWTVPVVFTTTGALPTGLTAGTTYWVISSTVTANTFQVATSAANALAGTAINTSGTQSGTHTGTAGAGLTSGANSNACAINLPAGDFDVSAQIGFLPAASTSITQYVGSWSTNSAALGGNGQLDVNTIPATVWGVNQGHANLPTNRISVASATPVYGVANSTFTVSTNTAFCFMGFRRSR